MQVSGHDDWIEERCLGAGGFGTVTLWKHKYNHEYLAIKKCRLDLSPANRQRWHQEVEILKKLDHANIVKAKDVPAILDVSGGEIPLLAMEYCEGGDLRRILNTPENIRGLKESTVIEVTADVAHAIEFLHSKRIIHRDLKPENIVIQHTDGKDIYKLIDLGYAKQLDQYSIATTFVGTLRYLAPELLAGNGSYTKTVDYWSLGTVLFECITGIRPFPDLSPVNWHREIGQKSPRHIHAFYNASDEMTFSEVFPELNTLSRCFQEKYVNLLRLLLLWDPVKRGGQVHEDGSRQCYKLLHQILDSKVVHIFCAFTSTLLTFEVTQTDRREDINARIYEETGIALDDQVIVSPAGQEIGADSPMLEYIHKNNGTPSTLYLFSKSSIPASPRPLFTLPSTLQSVVTESKTLLPYLEQKRIHAEALSYCYKQMKNYKYLIQAHLTLLKYTLKLHSRLSQLRTNLTSDCIRLEERITFCRESLYTDIEHFSDVAVDLHVNDTILRSWREGERNWIHFDKSGVMEAEKLAISAQTQVLELQKIPFNQSQPVSNPMEEIYNSAVIVYDDFKRANLTSYDQKMADCSKIAEVVLKCLTKREKLNKEMFTHLRRILQCATELQNVVPKVIEKTRQIAHHKDHILQIQKQRQEDVWCLISNKQDIVDSGINYPTLDLTLSSYKMDSSELTKQSLQNIERLSEVVQSVKVEYGNAAPESLDWSFLEEDTEV